MAEAHSDLITEAKQCHRLADLCLAIYRTQNLIIWQYQTSVPVESPLVYNMENLKQCYHSYSGSMEQGAIQWLTRFTGKQLKPDFTQYTLHN
jgi:hypothetical protein